MAWKECCVEYWLKELQESMDRCIGHRNTTEILLKTALNTITISQIFNSSNLKKKNYAGSKFWAMFWKNGADLLWIRMHCGNQPSESCGSLVDWEKYWFMSAYAGWQELILFLKSSSPPFTDHDHIGDSNTVVSAYTMYRHLLLPIILLPYFSQ